MTPWTLFLYLCATAGGLVVLGVAAGVVAFGYCCLRGLLMASTTTEGPSDAN